jgi:hypothetical protein
MIQVQIFTRDEVKEINTLLSEVVAPELIYTEDVIYVKYTVNPTPKEYRVIELAKKIESAQINIEACKLNLIEFTAELEACNGDKKESKQTLIDNTNENIRMFEAKLKAYESES